MTDMLMVRLFLLMAQLVCAYLVVKKEKFLFFIPSVIIVIICLLI